MAQPCGAQADDDAPAVLLPGDMGRIAPLIGKYLDWRLLILADEREEATLILAAMTKQAKTLEIKLLALALRKQENQIEAVYFLLGLTDGKRANKFLNERMAGGAVDERIYAARALMAGNPNYFAALISLAKSGKVDDKRVAANAFAFAGPKAIEHLGLLASNSNQAVRLSVYMSLGEIGTEKGEDMLHNLLGDADNPIDRIMLLRAITLATHIETDQVEMRAAVLAQSQLGAIQEQSTVIADLVKTGKNGIPLAKRGQKIMLSTMDELILRLETTIDESMGAMMAAAQGQLTPEMAQAMAAQAQMQAMQASLTPSQSNNPFAFSRKRPADFAAASLKLRPLARSVAWGKLPGVDPEKVSNALNSQKLPERFKRVLRAYYRALAEAERKKAK